jgi:hypothetical protein
VFYGTRRFIALFSSALCCLLFSACSLSTHISLIYISYIPPCQRLKINYKILLQLGLGLPTCPPTLGCLTSRRPLFASGQHVGFVMGKAALRQVFSEYFGFPWYHSTIITRVWHNRTISGRIAEWIQLDFTPQYTNFNFFRLSDLVSDQNIMIILYLFFSTSATFYSRSKNYEAPQGILFLRLWLRIS